MASSPSSSAPSLRRRRRRLCELDPSEIDQILQLTQMGADLDEVNTALATALSQAPPSHAPPPSSHREGDLLLECLADQLGKSAIRMARLREENGQLRSSSGTFQDLRLRLRNQGLHLKAAKASLSAAQEEADVAKKQALAARRDLAQAKAHFRDKDARSRMAAAAKIKRARAAVAIDARVETAESAAAMAKESARGAARRAELAEGEVARLRKEVAKGKFVIDKQKSQLAGALSVSAALEDQVRSLKAKLEGAAALFRSREKQWRAELEAGNARYREMHDHWSAIHKATTAKLLSAQSDEAAAADATLRDLLKANIPSSPPLSRVPQPMSGASDLDNSSIVSETVTAAKIVELEALVSQLQASLSASHERFLAVSTELDEARLQIRIRDREGSPHLSSSSSPAGPGPGDENGVLALELAEARDQIMALEAEAARARRLEAELDHTRSLLSSSSPSPLAPDALVESLRAELNVAKATAEKHRASVASLEQELLRTQTDLAFERGRPRSHTPPPPPARSSQTMTPTHASPSVSRVDAQIRVLQDTAAEPLTPQAARDAFGSYSRSHSRSSSRSPTPDSPGSERSREEVAAPGLAAKVLALEALSEEKDALIESMQDMLDALVTAVRNQELQQQEEEESGEQIGRDFEGLAYSGLQALLSAAEAMELDTQRLGDELDVQIVPELGDLVADAAAQMADDKVTLVRESRAAQMKAKASSKNVQSALDAREAEIRSLESQLSSLSFALEKDAAAHKQFRKQAGKSIKEARAEVANLKRANASLHEEANEAIRSQAKIKASFAKWRKQHSSCLLHEGGSRPGIRKVLAVLQASIDDPSSSSASAQASAISNIVDDYVRCVSHHHP